MSENKRSTGATAPSRREQLRAQQAKEESRAKRNKVLIAVLSVLAIAGIITGVAIGLNHHNSPKASAAQIVPTNATSDGLGITANPGKAKAGVPTLVIYQDYQCPACKEATDLIGTFTDQLAESGDINLQYRTMTFLDERFPNANNSSERAAIAADCADTVGYYMQYHDAVYANQSTTEGTGYTDDQLTNTIAKQAGITGANLTKFQQCYNDKATKNFVDKVDTAANKAGITSTPTYLVNGNKLDLSTVGSTKESLLAAIKAAAK